MSLALKGVPEGAVVAIKVGDSYELVLTMASMAVPLMVTLLMNGRLIQVSLLISLFCHHEILVVI